VKAFGDHGALMFDLLQLKPRRLDSGLQRHDLRAHLSSRGSRRGAFGLTHASLGLNRRGLGRHLFAPRLQFDGLSRERRDCLLELFALRLAFGGARFRLGKRSIALRVVAGELFHLALKSLDPLLAASQFDALFGLGSLALVQGRFELGSPRLRSGDSDLIARHRLAERSFADAAVVVLTTQLFNLLREAGALGGN
jgi:hypothetical protein